MSKNAERAGGFLVAVAIAPAFGWVGCRCYVLGSLSTVWWGKWGGGLSATCTKLREKGIEYGRSSRESTIDT